MKILKKNTQMYQAKIDKVGAAECTHCDLYTVPKNFKK